MDTHVEAGRHDVPRISLTVPDVALSTGFSPRRIWKAIEDNKLTARKNGRATVVELPEVARWVSSLPTRGRQPESAAA
jgi:hypothetical protein